MTGTDRPPDSPAAASWRRRRRRGRCRAHRLRRRQVRRRGRRRAPRAAGKFTGKYTGPAVTLAYWNGFTGGDGPFMDKLVKQFQHREPEDHGQAEHHPVGRLLPEGPGRGDGRQGPGRRRHAPGPARHQRRAQGDPAGRRRRRRRSSLEESDFSPEVWKAGIYQDKRYGIPLDVHSLAMYWRTDDAEKAGVTEAPPTDKASFDQALQGLPGRAASTSRSGCPPSGRAT